MELTALEVFGFLSVGAMVLFYALEQRSPSYVLAFAGACAAAALYAVLTQAWPFAAVEAVWCLVAVRRWWAHMEANSPPGAL